MTEKAFALILCGGRSSRMGADKPGLVLDGSTLLERAAAFWSGVSRVQGILAAVGAKEHLPMLPEGVTPVYDAYPGCGPMAGIHAAFTQTDADFLYVSAVDMPFLRIEALPPLPGGDAAVYTKNGRPEPLFGVYRRSCLPALEAALRRGERKMSALLGELDTEYLSLPDDLVPALANLNTRADYLRALAGSPPTVVCMGWSGSGKTTFLEKLIPALTARGLRIAVLKHDGHGFQMDKPGKDTWRFARAGAAAVAIAGPNGWAVLSPDRIELEALRDKLPPADLILAEGYKNSGYPKLEVHRAAAGKPFISRNDALLLAAITDEPVETVAPQLGLEDADACAELILRTFLPEKG